jgi:large subunit ribosomal protein L10
MSEYVTKMQQFKVDAVNALKDDFQNVKDFIFTDYRGLTVEQITELRGKLREHNAIFKVVKNRYAKIALEQMEKPGVGQQLMGPTAVALTLDESGPVAKVLVEFAGGHSLEIKGGIIDNEVFDAVQVKAFSKLPTRLELISRLMATIKAPVQNMVYILNAVPEKLVRTLKAVADQKEGK